MRWLILIGSILLSAPTLGAEVEIGTVKAGKARLKTGKLKTRFKDGMRVERQRVIKRGGDWVLERQGKRPNGQCRTQRIVLVKVGGRLIIPARSVNWEECRGQNCSLCEFKDTGGCACREPVAGGGASTCNHVVGKDDLRAIVRVPAPGR